MFDPAESTLGSPGPLADRVRPNLEQGIRELIVMGFERWKAEGFRRFGEKEDDFTAVLIGHILAVSKGLNSPFRPRPETVQYSQDILEGRVNPRTAPRPDITIWWGDVTEDQYITVECKCLAPGRLCREYVHSGMMRFISGKYGSGDPWDVMVGYVVGGDPDALHEVVNRLVRASQGLGGSHCLEPAPPIRSLRSVYRSHHQRVSSMPEIHLTHLFLDIRVRPPVTAA